ncbi:MAG: hypothetical protein ACOYXM_03440 [Actinomycetota bacterium]
MGSSPWSTRRLSWPAPISTGVRGSTILGASSRELDRSVKSREQAWHTYNRPIDVLLLCTANQCRSPMAEVLLRRRLEEAGTDAMRVWPSTADNAEERSA